MTIALSIGKLPAAFHYGILILLFYFSVTYAEKNDTFSYPKNEISFLMGFPDVLGFRYLRSIGIFSFGLKPGFVSYAFGKKSAIFYSKFAPSLYFDTAFKRKKIKQINFIDHKIELNFTPFFDTRDYIKYREEFAFSLRYNFVLTIRKSRMIVGIGPVIWHQPESKTVAPNSIEYIVLPIGLIGFGTAF